MPKRVQRPTGVHLALEFDGMVQAYFTECSGIGSEQEVREFREGGANGQEAVRKLPGLNKFGNITLKRGIGNHKSLWEWRKQVIDGASGDFRKNGSIVLYDRKRNEVARWDFRGAWPSKIAYSRSEADGNELGFEELTIAHEYIERVS